MSNRLDMTLDSYVRYYRYYNAKKNLSRINKGELKYEKIFLNESTYFDLRNDSRLSVTGAPGTGKSWTALLIASQCKNVLFFDPQGNAMDNLEKMNEDSNWNYYKISEKGKNLLKINVSELNSRILQILFKGKTLREQKIRIQLKKFFGKRNRTFLLLQEMLDDIRASYILDDLSMILSEDDEGIPMKELDHGRNVIDISHIDPQNPCVAAFVESLIGLKLMKKLKKDKLLVCFDECQSTVEGASELARAVAEVSGRGRAYGISTMIAGVNLSNVNKIVKKQLNTFLVFRSTYDINDMRARYGIDIDMDMIEQLPKGHGHCLYYNILNRGSSPKLVNINNYFQERLDDFEEKQLNNFGRKNEEIIDLSYI